MYTKVYEDVIIISMYLPNSLRINTSIVVFLKIFENYENGRLPIVIIVLSFVSARFKVK